MKIGLYTIHAAYNFGAMFQAYATQHLLKQLGHEPSVINLYTKEKERSNESRLLEPKLKSVVKYACARTSPKLKRKFERFKEFHGLLPLTRRFYSVEEVIEAGLEFDLHLVGSDQVWNLQNGMPEPAYFYLDFLHDEARRMSFASSFGTASVDASHYPELKRMLGKFEALSSRESDGVRIIEEATGFTARHVPDPTFFLSADEWSDLASDRLVEGDYILYYGFDTSEFTARVIENARKRLNMPVIAISVGFSVPFDVDEVVKDGGPREYLSLVRHARFMIVNSFHGLAFAINFRKDFLSIRHPTRNSRIDSVLDQFALQSRQVEDPAAILRMADDELSVDYSRIETKLSDFVSESREWLSTGLGEPSLVRA